MRNTILRYTCALMGVCLLCLVASPPAAAQKPPGVTYLRTEYKVNPIGIDVLKPRFSWQLVSADRGVVQTAYQIRVAEEPGRLRRNSIWDTGKVASGESIHREYEGPALESGKRYYWQVRVWDQNDRASEWSEPAFWEMGLLNVADWKASWITPDLEENQEGDRPSPMLRKTFSLQGKPVSARVYVSALGLYEMEINGRTVGDQVFTPGWTSYDHRIQYQTYDVTDLLQAGENAVGAMLGDGWYRGNLAWEGNRNLYGDKLALIAQIHVKYRNGREEWIVTDESWQSSYGPILMSDIYEGETYDARLEKEGWSSAGYDASDWAGVKILNQSKDVLVAPAGPPVVRVEELKPVEIIRTPEGDVVFDMGQNMVGRVRLTVQGPAGTTITLRHAEVLDKYGNFYTENLRTADQKVTYILKGEGQEVYEPHFTFQGFRYVDIDGFPGEPTLDNITGIVIHSDITPTGTFACSNPLINQLQHNIVWGQKGNFLDVPTDCPQRDERLGWTGDAQAFIRTAAFNADVASFFTKWLADVAADQKPNGAIPYVVPDVLSYRQAEGGGSAGWADVGTIAPWTLYLVYGDTRILERQYESMKAWVEFQRREAGDDLIWDKGFHFGDWLAYSTNRSDYPGATTDKDLIATAFFGYSTSLLQRTAEVLGKTEDAKKYAALFSDIKKAFAKEFMTPTGRLSSNTQTAYVLALWFNLFPEELRASATDRLVRDIRSFENHLTTGFLGTPYLCHALSSNGRLDVAYDLLNQKTYPSWLYPVTMGATTIWERWDGIKPDSTFQDKGMNSFNHYAYGAIGEWLYSVVAGIDVDPKEPGYKHVLIQPQPGGGLTYAQASLNTMYGKVVSDWKIEGDRFTLAVTVPPNTHATIRLPGAVQAEVTEGGQALGQVPGITGVRQDGSAVVVETGSGSYTFSYPATNLGLN
jgi:alpha-L-rhamnosidase